jgi:dTDP-4-amino-4,6-dideoxygalactose transaminase
MASIAIDKPALEGGTPVRNQFLIFGQPRLEEAEIQEVVQTLRSGWISTGPKVGQFEQMFAEYIGTRHALALNSCTAALHLSMLAAGVKAGDEVITTPLTFAATANVIVHVGARPVFADVDPKTLNINPIEIEKKITPKTKVIIPVHLGGYPCDMPAIMAIARKRHLAVIEDCAHAIESQIKGKHAGQFGDLGAFSFYVTKNLVTGEGGMVTTNNTEWAEKIQMYGLHGLNKGAWKRYSDEGFKHYQVIYPGYKYNMMDLQAAIGIHQLPRMETYLKRREAIWKKYNAAFADLPVILPAEPPAQWRHARHLYAVQLDLNALTVSRDHIMEALHRENIGTGIHYVSLHLHHFYKETFGYQTDDFPHAAKSSRCLLSLPLSAQLTDEEVSSVIEAFRKVILYYYL